MEAPARRQVVVWDLPTRLFHWVLVLLVALDLFAVEPEGGSSTVLHFLFGYAIAGLLVFRLLWGFIGSRRSRFADFVRPWSRVRGYVERLLRLDPPDSIGHNPLGGWMILALLGILLLMIATGLLAANRRAAGPFAHILGAGGAGLMGELHSLLSSLLVALAILHIAGVFAGWLLTGKNLILSMLNGRKSLSEAEAAVEPPPAPNWRAVVAVGLAILFAGWLALTTDYTRTRATLASSIGQSTQAGGQ